MAAKEQNKSQASLSKRAKMFLREKADATPLGLLYILNVVFFMYWMADVFIPDPLPLVDEVLLTGGLYYYNVYLLKRTFGIINPVKIMKREDPSSKKRAGILPYEKNMALIRKKLKELRKEVKKSDIPGMDESKVDKLYNRVKEIEKRLHKIDRLLSKGAFKAAPVKSEIERLESLMESAQDEDMKEEYRKSLSHARGNLENIERILEERNRLVTRLDRFRLQIDDSYSRIMAMNISSQGVEFTGELFDELFSSVDNFDITLQEIERRPAPGEAPDYTKGPAKETDDQRPRRPDKTPTN